MRLIVIYNTRAGKKQNRIRSRIEAFFHKREVLSDIFDYDNCNWQRIKDICASDTSARFVVAGGDGTLRRVLEFLWKNDLLKHAVAFMPIGSWNIVAYSLRLPFNIRHVFEKAMVGTPKPLDLGVLNNERVFFIGVALGKIATMPSLSGRSLKRRFGIFAFLIRLLPMFIRDYTKENFNVRIIDEANKVEETVQTHSMFVLNHLNVSRLQPRRGVLADDGKLDVVTLHNTSYWGLIRALFHFYLWKGNSKMLRHIQTSSVRCELSGFHYHMSLDGDYYEYPETALNFKILPGAASFII